MKAHIEIVKQLKLYRPTSNYDNNDIKSNVKNVIHELKSHDKVSDDVFLHYPILIGSDGLQWAHANRYLLSRINKIPPASHRTLESIAGDLMHFRNWLDKENVAYLKIPERTRTRPTYRYCTHLHDEIELSNIQPSTAKRRMNSVQNFYRWLKKDGVKFDNELWIEKESTRFFTNGIGLEKRKTIKITDLSSSFKSNKNNDDYSEHINDGGKLRPLSKIEQASIIESLKRIKNTEMTLAFLLALTTGARLQTIFTLRIENFLNDPYEGAKSYRIKAGRGTLIDTKFQRQIVILIPVWLYIKIQTYIKSERFAKRREAAPHIFPNEDHQYIFLTKMGLPYYMAGNDPFRYLYKIPPRGNAVTQFIRQQLRPDMLKNGNDFEFRFHDLRASFGMNIIEEKLVGHQHGATSKSNHPEFLQVLMYVRSRMGHSSITTTEAYLNYRSKYHLAVNTQGKYESHLETLMNDEEIYHGVDKQGF